MKIFRELLESTRMPMFDNFRCDNGCFCCFLMFTVNTGWFCLKKKVLCLCSKKLVKIKLLKKFFWFHRKKYIYYYRSLGLSLEMKYLVYISFHEINFTKFFFYVHILFTCKSSHWIQAHNIRNCIATAWMEFKLDVL